MDGQVVEEGAGAPEGLVDEPGRGRPGTAARVPSRRLPTAPVPRMRVTPSFFRAKRLARYGTREGLCRWPSPCRFRSASGTPSTSVVTIGPDGFPKGCRQVRVSPAPSAPSAFPRPVPPMIASMTRSMPWPSVLQPPCLPAPAGRAARAVYTKGEGPLDFPAGPQKNAAATYSPAQLPVQYHRLWQA